MPSNNADWISKTKPRVNYALLTNDNRYSNQVVSILGRLNSGSVDPSGFKISIETSDRQNVVIRLRDPVDGRLTSFVEFICRVGGSGARDLQCLNFTPIDDEITENFDFDVYNKMLEVTNQFSSSNTGGGDVDPSF